MNGLPNTLTDDFVSQHLAFHPVDATFMGISGHDHKLPPMDAEVADREHASLIALQRRVGDASIAETAGERTDLRLMQAQIRLALRELEDRPRYDNPTWYTSEAAFGVISLLLPSAASRPLDELRALLLKRITEMSQFLSKGRQYLVGRPIPAEWAESAKREARALARLLQRGIRLHPAWSEKLDPVCAVAAREALQFDADLSGHADANPACGEEYLAFLMKEVHGLPYTPKEAEELAQIGFEESRQELETMAEQLTPGVEWREQIAQLALDHPSLDQVIETYSQWHEIALEGSTDLLTPACDYGLSYQKLPRWAHEIAGDLYFLFYRSPSSEKPGTESVYWIFPPGANEEAYLRSQNTAMIKSVHVVHHGSIGHHTQNSGARSAESRLARLAGTDCASNIAFLSGGTMIEGWACYAQGLMVEVEGFYSPLELLLLKQFEMRNAASCLGDIRLHNGDWSVDQLRTFYSDEVGYDPSRLWSGTVRNSIYPGTRLMYWLGTQAIRQMRAKWSGTTKDFHNRLLYHGAMPIHWVAEEMGLSL